MKMTNKKEEYEWYFYILLALIFIYFFLIFTIDLEKFFLSFCIYYCLYKGVLKLLEKFFKKKGFLLIAYKSIIGFPLVIAKIAITSWYYVMQILLFLLITFSVLPTIVMSIFPEKFYFGALYLGVLLSVILFAYAGHILWRFVKNFYGNKDENKLILQSNNIALIYIIMICVYIFYNIMEFSKVYVSFFIEKSTFLILKEVLVTFIAIDGFRQLVLKKNQDC